MKTNTSLIFVALFFSTLNYQSSALFAQGSLTPPGAPAPTMLSLNQIEPRTPISSAPYNIGSPGAYYLTGNLSVTSGTAITIGADNVTLDLNGFSITSTESSPAGTGILLSGGRAHVHILNGHIRGYVTQSGGSFSGAGFLNGIGYTGGNIPLNVRVSGVSVSGCKGDGINLVDDNSTIVESCTVDTAGGHGLWANTVRGSVASNCGLTALFANNVSDSYGFSFTGFGIFAILNASNCSGYGAGGVNAETASNCYGESTGSSYGIQATTATNCYGVSANTYGVFATTAINCDGSSSSSYGIYAVTASNCNGATGSSTYGINAVIASNCQGSSSGGAAISATSVSNCYGSSGTGGVGFFVNPGGVAQFCIASNSSIGILAGNNCTIANCTAYNNSGDGISFGSNCLISGNNSSSNTNHGNGFHGTGTQNRIDGNTAIGNSGYGFLSFTATADFIIRNTAFNNGGTAGSNATVNYSPSSGTYFGPLSIPGNASVSPWANF